MGELITVTLHGRIPSKKNEWKRGARGVYIPEETKTALALLELQARAQWGARGRRAPLAHPEITTRLYLPDKRRDKNNLHQTVMDVLVFAGILRDDNIAQCNGREVIEPVEISDRERVVVTLREAA